MRGILVDYYVDLDATTKADLKLLKTTLMKKAGLPYDLLTEGKLFISCCLVNAIFYTDSLVGQMATKVLLDTGAAVSVT